MKVLDFGKNKGKFLKDCEPSYILWIALHEQVLHPDNRWASQEAFKILSGPSQAAQVCLEQINAMYKCLFFAKYEFEKKQYQIELNNRINYMKEQYGYSVREKYHEYIFA